MPGPPTGPAFCKDDDGILGDIEIYVVDPHRHVVVILEYDGRSLVLVQLRFSGRVFDDRAVGSEITFQHDQTALLGHRVIERADHLVIVNLGTLQILAECIAVCRHGIEMQFRGEASQEAAETTGVIEIFHQVASRWSDIGDDRRVARQGIEQRQVDIDTRPPSDSEKVNSRVGRAAERHDRRDRIFQRFFGENLSRF